MAGGRRRPFSVSRVWILLCLLRVVGGRSVSVYQVCLYFFSVHCGQPKAGFQHIESIVYFLAAHGGRPAAAFQVIQVYFACLSLFIQGGQRPLFNTFVLLKRFLCCVWRVTEGRISVYLGSCLLFEAHCGQPKVAFQNIHVHSITSWLLWRVAEGRLPLYLSM